LKAVLSIYLAKDLPFLFSNKVQKFIILSIL